MRILYCNKYNYPFSGTEVYLFELMELMRSQGHETALFSMADPRGKPTPYDRHFVPHIEFKKQSGWLEKARSAAHAIYSWQAREKVRAMIKDFRPDVAHVRNIYHHLSPSILWELRAQGVPVIYHVNDFKLLCPSYNLVSQGEACEACKGGRFRHVLLSKCYPGLAARIALATEAYVHKWLGTYGKCVDRFLAPSNFVRDTFVAHGWDGAKFEVLPHFQKLPVQIEFPAAKDSAVLYFGRLSREKGLDDLLWAMKRLPHMRLVIAGEGPQQGELQALAGALGLSNVEFVGQLSGARLDELIARSCFTVFPSHAYETLGKSILESYAKGRPVVASDMGSRRELVHEGETGILYPTGDVNRLTAAMKALNSRPDLADQMGRAGRELVRQRHTAESHYQAIWGLYQRVVSAKRRSLLVRGGAPKWQRLPPSIGAQGSLTFPALAPKPRLKIAFIGGRGVVSKYSGIEAYYEEVGRRLVELGHEVTVYCRSYFTPPIKEYQGMRLVRLPTIRSKHLETIVHTALSTADVLARRCDVVHYHALGPAVFSFLPRLLRKKTVVTVQGLDWQRKKWGRLAAAGLRIGEQASAHLPSRTMVVSQTLQRHYRDAHETETLYVPNGGVLREPRSAQKIFQWGLEAGKYILFLGRFSPEKGCHILLNAYEQLDTNVTLVMAGAPSYCDDYSRALRSHAGESIKMLDWVEGDTLDELLTNAMLFVLPSDMEGLSLALLDAMGAGLCVLTSDVPENCEVVDGVGFTFQCGNASDLAARLRFLIANPGVRKAAGQAARRRVLEKYQWSKIAADIEKAYFVVMGWDPGEVHEKKPSASVAAPAAEQLGSNAADLELPPLLLESNR